MYNTKIIISDNFNFTCCCEMRCRWRSQLLIYTPVKIAYYKARIATLLAHLRSSSYLKLLSTKKTFPFRMTRIINEMTSIDKAGWTLLNVTDTFTHHIIMDTSSRTWKNRQIIQIRCRKPLNFRRQTYHNHTTARPVYGDTNPPSNDCLNQAAPRTLECLCRKTLMRMTTTSFQCTMQALVNSICLITLVFNTTSKVL